MHLLTISTTRNISWSDSNKIILSTNQCLSDGTVSRMLEIATDYLVSIV